MPTATTPVDATNHDQERAWDGPEGSFWAAHHEHFEASLARYQSAFLDAAAIRPADRVLDVGCGTGVSTRDAARAARAGRARRRPLHPDDRRRPAARRAGRAGQRLLRAGRRPGAPLRRGGLRPRRQPHRRDVLRPPGVRLRPPSPQPVGRRPTGPPDLAAAGPPGVGPGLRPRPHRLHAAGPGPTRPGPAGPVLPQRPRPRPGAARRHRLHRRRPGAPGRVDDLRAHGSPVLLLHGSGSAAVSWAAELAELGRTRRVHAIDPPGESGLSAPGRLPLARGVHARWLHDVASALGADPAIVVGVSLGGWVALDYAFTHPGSVSELVLFSRSGIGPRRVAPLLLAVALGVLGDRSRRRALRHLLGPGRPEWTGPLHRDLEALALTTLRHFRPRTDPIPVLTDDELRALPPALTVVLGARDRMLRGDRAAARRATPRGRAHRAPAGPRPPRPAGALPPTRRSRLRSSARSSEWS